MKKVLPWRTLPLPDQAWGMGVVGGWAGAVLAPQLNTDTIFAP